MSIDCEYTTHLWCKAIWLRPYYTFTTDSLERAVEACGVTADTKQQLFATGCSRLLRVHILAAQQTLLWQACFVFHTITPHEKTFHNTVLCSCVFSCFSVICPTSFSIYFSSVVFISPIPFSNTSLNSHPELEPLTAGQPKAAVTSPKFSRYLRVIPAWLPCLVALLLAPTGGTLLTRHCLSQGKQRASLVWITLRANLSGKGGPVREWHWNNRSVWTKEHSTAFSN